MDRKKVSLVIAIIFFVLFALYASFEMWKLVKGPEIIIYNPKDGQTLTSPEYDLKGKALRVSYINLNGRQIFTDMSGNFEEKLIALPGYNTITVQVSDRYNRVEIKKIRVYRIKSELDDETLEIPKSASSTQASTTRSN